MIINETTDILNTPFYIYRGSHGLFLGVITPFGVIACQIDNVEWIDWLRKEIIRSTPTEIPKCFQEMK